MKQRRLIILGQTWTVIYVESLTEGSEAPVYGSTDIDRRIIKIATAVNNTPALLQSTLLHEVIHAVLGIAGVSAMLTERTEEAIVLALESGLSPLVRLK